MAKKSKKSFGYFTHGKEADVVQMGAIGLVLGSVAFLIIVASRLY
jgi:hypothetical protein